MGIFDRELIVPATINDLVDARNNALAMIEGSIKAMKSADEIIQSAGVRYWQPPSRHGDSSFEEYNNSIDRNFWRRSFDLAGFFKVMDEEAMNDFSKSLESRDLPEFTIDNIRTTFLSHLAEAELLYKRGIVNVFKHLSKEYWHNRREPFSIANKVILNHMIDKWYGMRVRREVSARVNDIDRIFHLVDNKDPIDRRLEDAINLALKEELVYEDEYFLIRGYKNGNMHITFKRQDLLDEVNGLIAEWYGENTLANGVAA